jgi:hypothetical protein
MYDSQLDMKLEGGIGICGKFKISNTFKEKLIHK